VRLGTPGQYPPAPLRIRPTPVMPGPMSLLRTTFQSVPRLTGVTVLPTSSYPTMASMPRLTARGMSWAFPVSPASRYPSMASMRRTTARGMSWAFPVSPASRCPTMASAGARSGELVVPMWLPRTYSQSVPRITAPGVSWGFRALCLPAMASVPMWLLRTLLQFPASTVHSATKILQGVTTSCDTLECVTESHKRVSSSFVPTSMPLPVTEMGVLRCAQRVYE
jgi:hypothetical protein